MIALDIEFEKAMHYHHEGYESGNDYGLTPHVMRPVHVYSIFTAEASYNPAEYTVAQCPISLFTPQLSKSLPFHEGVCWHLPFDEMPPLTPEEDSED